jgi:Pyruvate/2-oxoacid:ferredoxin oxidoreductase delta subunit
MTTKLPQILYCHCAYAQVVPPEIKAGVLKQLCESGIPFEAVADLCEMAARKDAGLKRLAGAPVKIAACYPRAVKWLLTAAGASPAAAEVFNMREQGVDEIVHSMLGAVVEADEAGGGLKAGERFSMLRDLLERGFSVSHHPDSGKLPPSEMQVGRAGEWIPWFPVIDYERCTQCMQCLGFCLFGVFGVDEKNQIRVQSSENCKTNCPACARVCPEAAIIFPKYKAGPINGDQVSQADLQREKMKIDISALLGGDVYSMLRERSERAKSRFSKERNPDKALEERKKCLARLAQAGDIPPELLTSLPSPEEIARRAEEARAKASAALAAKKT